MLTKRQKLNKNRSSKITCKRKRILIKNIDMIKSTQRLEGIIIGKDLEIKMSQILKKTKTKNELMEEILAKYRK